jgi:hypothetical protein
MLNKFLSHYYIAMYSFGLLFVYQMIGVAIHKQFGFGFFYWPVQEYLLLILSLFIIFIYKKKFFQFFDKSSLIFNLYFISITLFLFSYIFIENYSNHITYEEKIEILFETIIWYVISLVMAFNLKELNKNISLKMITIIYFIVLLFFFIYIIKLNAKYGADIFRALIVGANFDSSRINQFLSASGYVKGFHLYFSPLFAVFSIFYLYKLKESEKKYQFFIIFLLAIYILFLASGRGSLLAFTFSVFLFMTNVKTKIISLSIIIFTFLPFANYIEEHNPRFYNVITLNVEDDPSAIGRIKDFQHNMEYIENNFLVGGLRGYFEIKSAYIHSALAILQEYGILIFLIFISMIIHSGLIFLKLIKHPQFIFIGSWLSYVVIDMALFKYIHEFKTMILFSIIYLYMLNLNKEKNVI